MDIKKTQKISCLSNLALFVLRPSQHFQFSHREVEGSSPKLVGRCFISQEMNT